MFNICTVVQYNRPVQPQSTLLEDTEYACSKRAPTYENDAGGVCVPEDVGGAGGGNLSPPVGEGVVDGGGQGQHPLLPPPNLLLPAHALKVVLKQESLR
jgi:hypothetical protein